MRHEINEGKTLYNERRRKERVFTMRHEINEGKTYNKETRRIENREERKMSCAGSRGVASSCSPQRRFIILRRPINPIRTNKSLTI